jgi:hypothetical protein
MRLAGLIALGIATLGLVIFIIVELYASRSPSRRASGAAPSGAGTVVAPAPPASTSAAPLAAPGSPPVPAPSAPPPGRPAPSEPELTPVRPAVDPLDTVVQGKTRREWHAYYNERQRETVAEIARLETIVGRAERGEEPDPKELGEAQTRLRELRVRLKSDLEALQRLDAP